MGRLFVKLYSLIALAGIVFFIVAFNLETIIEGTLTYHYGNLAKGTFFLLEKRLGETPEAQWPQLIAEVNQGGGYTVKLLPIETLTFDSSKMKQLKSGAVVLSEVHKATFTYKRLGDSHWVIEFPFEESEYVHIQRLVNSTFKLIEDQLNTYSQSDWPVALEQLKLQFKYPIHIIEQYQDDKLKDESRRLADREIVVIELDDNTEFFYRRIDNSPYILKLGPFDEPIALNYIQSIVMLFFSILVALAVLYWVYPLSRDLKQLGMSTKAFGQGDFSERVSTNKHSVLFRLAGLFNAMADRIQALISSHKELTNAVSHELRTPIARLRFGMEMLQDSTEEEDRTRFMESMNADIDELDQLVAELLTYARFDRDTPVLEFQRQEIYPWLNEIVRQEKMGREQLSIEFEIAGQDLKYARFDPMLLARALSNLLQNAKRYASSEIKIVFSNEDGYFKLSVDDDGEGIPEADRESIFDAFKRLDASRDRGTGGFGLGLSIAQQISQWHGGEITITDSPLGGARFTICWPEEKA